MNYIWEALLKADKENISRRNIKFKKAEVCSPYMEMSLEDINMSLLPEENSIEVNVYYRFYEIFKELASLVDHIDIIAGNHDYYSPVSDDICVLNVIFDSIKNIDIHSKAICVDGVNLYVPWYQWLDNSVREALPDLIKGNNIGTDFSFK